MCVKQGPESLVFRVDFNMLSFTVNEHDILFQILPMLSSKFLLVLSV